MKKLSALILSFFFLYGCGGARTIAYVNPAADLSYVKKVAILPFNNFSQDRYAGEKIRNLFTVALLARGVFDVVERGEVRKVLNTTVFPERGVEEGGVLELDGETIRLIGEGLGVQAIIIGSVDEYSGGFGGKAVVSIALRMIDTSSGIVLWETKVTESSRSVWRKLVGIEELDKEELARRAVEKAIDTLL